MRPTMDETQLTDGTPTIASGADGYVPGACNIGPAEIRLRRDFGIAGLVVAVVLAAALLVVDAPSVARWLVALPLAGGLTGLLQARRRFCVNFAVRGLVNFGGRDDAVRVEDRAARLADLRAAGRLVLEAAFGAVVLTAVFVLLPV